MCDPYDDRYQGFGDGYDVTEAQERLSHESRHVEEANGLLRSAYAHYRESDRYNDDVNTNMYASRLLEVFPELLRDQEGSPFLGAEQSLPAFRESAANDVVNLGQNALTLLPVSTSFGFAQHTASNFASLTGPSLLQPLITLKADVYEDDNRHWREGIRALESGKHFEALVAFNKATIEDAQHGPSIFALERLLRGGFFAYEGAIPSDEIDVAKAAMRDSPEDSSLVNTLAQLIYASGDVHQANELWDQAVAMDNGLAANNRARSNETKEPGWYRRRDQANTMRLMEKAAKLQNPSAAFFLALARTRNAFTIESNSPLVAELFDCALRGRYPPALHLAKRFDESLALGNPESATSLAVQTRDLPLSLAPLGSFKPKWRLFRLLPSIIRASIQCFLAVVTFSCDHKIPREISYLIVEWIATRSGWAALIPHTKVALQRDVAALAKMIRIGDQSMALTVISQRPELLRCESETQDLLADAIEGRQVAIVDMLLAHGVVPTWRHVHLGFMTDPPQYEIANSVLNYVDARNHHSSSIFRFPIRDVFFQMLVNKGFCERMLIEEARTAFSLMAFQLGGRDNALVFLLRLANEPLEYWSLTLARQFVTLELLLHLRTHLACWEQLKNEILCRCNLDANGVRFLCEEGADPNFLGNESVPLLNHIEKFDCVQILLNYGANVNLPLPNGTQLIDYAVIRSPVEVIFKFIDEGASLTHQLLHQELQECPAAPNLLYLAMRTRTEESLVMALLDADFDVNAFPETRAWGRSPLSCLALAIQREHSIDVWERLIAKGADPTTGLEVAIERNVECVRFLIERGANVQVPCYGSGGVTTLKFACQCEASTEMLKLILEHGGTMTFDWAAVQNPLILE